jgi:hypothetical protein
MKITKRHINYLVEQRIKLDEKDYGFTSYDRGDDFFDPTKHKGGTEGERIQTVHTPHGSGRLTHKFKPVADYTYDARTDSDKRFEKIFGDERPVHGKTSVIQVDRPEGKRFYVGQQDRGELDGKNPELFARAKAQFTPSDSLSTQRMQNWIDKKDFDIDPSWDMFTKK